MDCRFILFRLITLLYARGEREGCLKSTQNTWEKVIYFWIFVVVCRLLLLSVVVSKRKILTVLDFDHWILVSF